MSSQQMYRDGAELVDVLRWTGENFGEARDLCGEIVLQTADLSLIVLQPEGDQVARPGDYVVRTMTGQLSVVDQAEIDAHFTAVA